MKNPLKLINIFKIHSVVSWLQQKCFFLCFATYCVILEGCIMKYVPKIFNIQKFKKSIITLILSYYDKT